MGTCSRNTTRLRDNARSQVPPAASGGCEPCSVYAEGLAANRSWHRVEQKL
jgi:hypothetical protein